MRTSFYDESWSHVFIRGVECLFSDIRIDRATVPQEYHFYEVADGDCNGIPARIRPGILANFYGTLLSKEILVPDDGDTIYLDEKDWKYET